MASRAQKDKKLPRLACACSNFLLFQSQRDRWVPHDGLLQVAGARGAATYQITRSPLLSIPKLLSKQLISVLGLELTDAGFDFSVLSEFRDHLLAGSAKERLLETLLERCCTLGLLKARGQQRMDSTHVLAAVRVLSRLELVAETLRAALNDLATVAPQWLQELAPVEWYERYGKRIEDSRLPRAKGARDAYAQAVGEDGFRVLDAVDAPEAPEAVRTLASITTLRRIWQRHYTRTEPRRSATRKRPGPRVRFKTTRELPPAAKDVESPYDTEARYRHKRDTQWTGYMVCTSVKHASPQPRT